QAQGVADLAGAHRARGGAQDLQDVGGHAHWTALHTRSGRPEWDWRTSPVGTALPALRRSGRRRSTWTGERPVLSAISSLVCGPKVSRQARIRSQCAPENSTARAAASKLTSGSV